MNSAPRERAEQAFTSRFGEPPALVVRAPGRVNLIGEHTDYNDGFVLPMAIDRATWIALQPRDDGVVVCHSEDRAEPCHFALDGLEEPSDAWCGYVEGVAWALGMAAGALAGWEGVVATDVPIGASMSSSAALEMAVARAFAAVSAISWDPVAMAQAGRRAENEWVGVSSGIMDQLTSAAGRPGHALLVDCRTLDIDPVPLPESVAVLVLDTGTRRSLTGSAYNERRRQCEAAAAALGVEALRDATLTDLTAAGLPPDLHRRAHHVITENARVLAAAQAMRAGDAAAMGTLMDASHASLRDDYEVSGPELDAITAAARSAPGCFGARMTGAGFAGSAIALVDAPAVEAATAHVEDAYRATTGRAATVYPTRAAGGAAVVSGAGA